MGELRLKGQEVSIRVVRGGVVVTTITAIASFNDQVLLERKQDQFLGETADRFDDIFRGYQGDFEFQVSKATWTELHTAMIARSRRATPDLVFNVIRTDYYADGSTATFTYADVFFGPSPTTVASRSDFVKVKIDFAGSERPQQISAVA